MRGAMIGVAAGSLLLGGLSGNLGSDGARSMEVWRVRSQLDTALVALAAADVGRLSDEQRGRRNHLITALREYRDAGAFPLNYDFAKPTPYFVDRQSGARCAVAFLLEHSGRRDIVSRVAATDNNVWVPSLRGDTAFTGWLATNGITLAEAALIQEPYLPAANLRPAPFIGSRVVGGVAASALVAVANVVNQDPAKAGWGIAAGVTAGLFSLHTSAPALRGDQPGRSAHTLNVALGAISLASTLRAAVVRDVGRQRQANEQRVRITPQADVAAGAAGLSVAVRF